MQSYKEEFTFDYLGHPIKVIVTYKNMKRMIYRTQSGVILISVPFHTSKQTLRRLLDSLPPKAFTALLEEQNIGEDYIYLLGKRHRLVSPLAPDKKEGDITFRSKEELMKRVSSLAKETITMRVRYYERLMQITKPYKIHIHNTTSRYGSNSRRTHSLAFALTLIHYPISVIDAVVVHELAHDRHFDHSPAFYAEINKYYPNYKKEMKKLKGGHHE